MTDRNSPRISIVIPTFNRSPYLRRALEFLTPRPANRSVYQLLVLDGSTNLEDRKANETLCQEKSVGYRFYDSSQYDFSMRVAAGLKGVATPYVLLVGDDDFVNPDVLPLCADFLDERTDFTACCGHYARFRKSPKRENLLILSIEPNRSIATYEQDSAFERLFWGMCEGPPTVSYALHRTSAISATFSRIVRCTQRRAEAGFDSQIIDLLWFSLVLIGGKVGNLQVPFMLRETGQSGNWSTFLPDEIWRRDSQFLDRYENAKAEMLDALPEGVPEQDASDALDAIWGIHFGQCFALVRMGGKLEAVLGRIEGKGNSPVRLFDRFTPRKSQILDYPSAKLEKEFDADAKHVADYNFALPYIAQYYGTTKVQIIDNRDLYWWLRFKPRF